MRHFLNDSISKNVGSGFIMGQGFALFNSAKHAFTSASLGNKCLDFLDRFRFNSIEMGIQSANWALTQGIVEPYIKKRFGTKWHNEIICGFIAGSLLNIRNGPKAIFKGAVNGAIQSGLMFCLSGGLAIAETSLPKNSSLQHEFFKERNKTVFKQPLTSIFSAFQSSNKRIFDTY